MKSLMYRKWTVVLFAAFVLAGLCIAAARAAEGDGDSEQQTGKPAAAVQAAADDITPSGTIQSLTLKKDMGIRDALRFLAARYHKNIVPSPNVQGQLAFSTLYEVTFTEALEAILGDDFKYEQQGNIIKVFTASEYQKIMKDTDRMIHKVFTLYYTSAEEAERMLQPVLSAAGQLRGSTAAEQSISVGSSSGGGGSSISGGGGGNSLALPDMVMMYDYPENIARAEEVVKRIDARPTQVLLEATILAATLTETNELGIDLNLAGGVSLDGSTDYSQVGTTTNVVEDASHPITQIAEGAFPGSPLETSGFAAVGGNGLRVGITSGDFTAFITALEGITDVTVLANPKILALNKQEGSVLIGQKIGYRSQTTQTDTSTTEQVEFLETGTRLVFRPFIGSDGYIRMDIYPKDSSATLNAQGIPDESTTELQTNIVVKDGQTVVIGGLFRDVTSAGRSQVPILGDLPLVGAAFRGTTDETQRQEVIILLTPHIIDEPEETNGQARAADVSRKRYGARQALQWVSRARLAEDAYARAVDYYTDSNSVAALYELKTALELRPTYIEALRLKERIIRETAPDEAARMERIMLDAIEREQAPMWRRY